MLYAKAGAHKRLQPFAFISGLYRRSSSFVGAPLVGALQGKAVQTWDVRNPQELRSLYFIDGGLYTAA